MRELFEKTIPVVNQAVDAFPWSDRVSYGQYTAQTYHYVSHSTRLLALSSARFSIGDEKLHRRFASHIVEENSHHLLALHDLKALDFDLAKFPELPATAAFYQRQYFLSGFGEPAALLGYILALEGVAVSRGKIIYEKVKEHHGVKAGTFLKVHAEDDVGHLEEAFKYVAMLNEQQQAATRDNFVASSHLFASLLDGCLVATKAQ